MGCDIVSAMNQRVIRSDLSSPVDSVARFDVRFSSMETNMVSGVRLMATAS